MTDNEVIMWAELCVNGSPAPCSACPFDGDTVTVDECMSKIITELLEINKHQQADVEFYKERANKYKAQVQVLLEQSRKQRVEIGKLKIVA